jgi:hypothetical protein
MSRKPTQVVFTSPENIASALSAKGRRLQARLIRLRKEAARSNPNLNPERPGDLRTQT